MVKHIIPKKFICGLPFEIMPCKAPDTNRYYWYMFSNGDEVTCYRSSKGCCATFCKRLGQGAYERKDATGKTLSAAVTAALVGTPYECK